MDDPEESQLSPPRRDWRDHIDNVADAAISEVLSKLPFGTFVSSLAAEYIPSSTRKAVSEAIQVLENRLDSLADRIDRDAKSIDPDEFSDSAKSFLLLTQRTSREEKLRGAANLLANQLLKDGDREKLSYTEADHFWRCLDSLSIGAIQLLGLICKRVEVAKPRKVAGDEYVFENKDVVSLMPKLPPTSVLSLAAELNAWYMVRMDAAGVSLVINGYRQNDQVFLTPTGMSFVETVLQAGTTDDQV